MSPGTAGTDSPDTFAVFVTAIDGEVTNGVTVGSSSPRPSPGLVLSDMSLTGVPDGS